MNEPNWFRHVPRNADALVDQQVHRWMLYDRGAKWKTATERESTGHWPVVTISREYGAQGTELGKRVAQRLGFHCWDREIVVQIAEKLKTNELSLVPLDERACGPVEELMGVALFGQPAMSADYREQLRWLVATIERRGSAVIVGRGAHCIVSPENALRVRVVAPLGKRVVDVCKRKQVDEKTALRLIRASDKERAEFMRKGFGANVDDARNYDLTINTASFDPERADVLVIVAYMMKFGRLPPGSWMLPEPRHPARVHEGAAPPTP